MVLSLLESSPWLQDLPTAMMIGLFARSALDPALLNLKQAATCVRVREVTGKYALSAMEQSTSMSPAIYAAEMAPQTAAGAAVMAGYPHRLGIAPPKWNSYARVAVLDRSPAVPAKKPESFEKTHVPSALTVKPGLSALAAGELEHLQ